MDDDKVIKPDDLCMVVRNTTQHPCIGKDIGRPVKVLARELVADYRITPFGYLLIPGLIPVWSTADSKCPHCGGIRCGYPEADLQKLRGPRQGKDVPAEKPVVIELGLVKAGTAITADWIVKRTLEALRG